MFGKVGGMFADLVSSATQKVQQTASSKITDKFNDITGSKIGKKQLLFLKFDENDLLPSNIQKIMKLVSQTRGQMQIMIKVIDNSKWKDYTQSLIVYLSVLGQRQKQLSNFLFLVQNQKNNNFAQQYNALIKGNQSTSITLDKMNQKLNLLTIAKFFEKQSVYLYEYQQKMNDLKKQIMTTMNDQKVKKMRNRLKVINAKFVTIIQIFPQACLLPLTDLFSLKPGDQRWGWLGSKFIFFKKLGDKEKVKESFESLKNNLNMVNATMNIIEENQGYLQFEQFDKKDWNSFWKTTGNVLKVAAFSDQAKDQSQSMISKGDAQLATKVWNLPDNKILKKFIGLSLPSIKYSQAIFIPRSYQAYLKDPKKQKFFLPNIGDPQSYSKQILIKKPYQKGLRLRINCPYQLSMHYKPKSKQSSSLFDNINSNINQFQKMMNSNEKVPEKLIYHVHGGGFVSMSTFFHQTYTRLWAKNLNVPIISVEYGKAPQRPFPMGLNDCFEGYIWSIYCFQQVFKANPKKIVLVGDSAGGNLIASLTNLLIQNGVRIPDGLCLVYPALNLDFFSYTPSLMNALDDMILPHTFLKVCLNAYFSNDLSKGKSSYLASPILTPDEILSQYPRTMIFVGSNDPVHDDCCRLLQRLNIIQPGIATLTVYEQFPHGFLQFDNEAQPHKYCKQAIKEVQIALGQLLL